MEGAGLVPGMTELAAPALMFCEPIGPDTASFISRAGHDHVPFRHVFGFFMVVVWINKPSEILIKLEL